MKKGILYLVIIGLMVLLQRSLVTIMHLVSTGELHPFNGGVTAFIFLVDIMFFCGLSFIAIKKLGRVKIERN